MMMLRGRQVVQTPSQRILMRVLRRTPVVQTPSQRMLTRMQGIARRIDPRIAGAGIGGAILAFLFDPKMGRTRRSQARQRIAGMFRGMMRRSRRAGRGINARANGYRRRVAHLRQIPKDWDDVTLAQKVQSEALGGAKVPKGSISVDAHDGIIVLRGTVDDARTMKRLEQAVMRVPGVDGVENLLHERGQPAPNKLEALRIGR